MVLSFTVRNSNVIGFFVYFFTAVGILLPAANAWLNGKAPLTVSQLNSTFVGPPGLLLAASLFSIFTPRFAGCLAFAGTSACWIYSGPNVVRSIIALFSSQTIDLLSKMSLMALAQYLLGWAPTLVLIFATFYSLRKALKIEKSPATMSSPKDLHA